MAYVLAFACGFWPLRVLAKRGYTQLRVEQVGDFITWAAVFGVMLGAPRVRLFYKPEMLRDPLSIVRVWKAGCRATGNDWPDSLYLLVCLATQTFLDQSR